MFQSGYAQLPQLAVYTLFDIRLGDAVVPQSESYIIVDRRHEQLVVGVLKHHTHSLADLPDSLLAKTHVTNCDAALSAVPIHRKNIPGMFTKRSSGDSPHVIARQQ